MSTLFHSSIVSSPLYCTIGKELWISTVTVQRNTIKYLVVSLLLLKIFHVVFKCLITNRVLYRVSYLISAIQYLAIQVRAIFLCLAMFAVVTLLSLLLRTSVIVLL